MKKMLAFVRRIEKAIIFILVVYLVGILIVSVVDFGLHFFDIMTQSEWSSLYRLELLMPLLSSFLGVLIGIELLETVKAYLKEDSIHVDLVILVAIIAIARKIIVLDYASATPEKLLGISALVISLGITYFLIKSTGLSIKRKNTEKTDEEEEDHNE